MPSYSPDGMGQGNYTGGPQQLSGPKLTAVPLSADTEHRARLTLARNAVDASELAEWLAMCGLDVHARTGKQAKPLLAYAASRAGERR